MGDDTEISARRNLESDVPNPSLADRIAAVLAEHHQTHISGLCSCGKSYPNEHDGHQAEQVAALFEQVGHTSAPGAPGAPVRHESFAVWRLADA